MLSDQDVLLLKLALERELLDAAGYRRVLEAVRTKGSVGGVGRALRVSGVAGERVGELAELVAAAGKDPSGAILSRSDLEDLIVAKAIGRSKLLPDEKTERARGELLGMARMGELTSLTEILVKRRWLEVPVAVELRRRARERVATCPRCWRHFVVHPSKAVNGRYSCKECQGTLLGAGEMRSAIEVARGGASSRPDFLGGGSSVAEPSKQKEPAKTPPSSTQPRRAQSAALPAAQARPDAFTPPSTPSGRRLAAEASTEEKPAIQESTADDPPSVAARWDSLEELEAAAPDVPAVATFGDYEILTEVARGGMGIVYKARRMGSSQLLALKVLISGVDATEEQVQRFEREGEAARRLRHKGIVRVHDAGRHEGYHYIAMEYVEGKTLEDLLAEGPLEPKRAAKIMAAVAEAVDHMHAAGIVHRDLKPGNIMLDASDEPKLIDFGLAKTVDRRAKLTQSGAAIGTPFYMPPEQVRGEMAKIGPLSDVYALGAIFIEMITGDPPYEAENPIELYHKIANAELVLPDPRETGLPEDLVNVAAKCLEKAPEDRYGSAALLAQDLRRFLAGQPVLAEHREHAPRARGPARGTNGPGAFLSALAGAAVALGLGSVALKAYLPRMRARDYQEDGEAALASKRTEDARVFFERALELVPGEPVLEVDLARAVASKDGSRALGLVEQAEKDGLKDAGLLASSELAPLADEPRFKEVMARVGGGRK